MKTIDINVHGTTSACAENTDPGLGRMPGSWNYLRVRGEYYHGSGGFIEGAELPPRARRIPMCSRNEVGRYGTTSACAENTRPTSVFRRFIWNYLRVRGEYAWACSVFCIAWELPPRARRIHYFQSDREGVLGTTSACAENTKIMPMVKTNTGNYLRVRGEYPHPSTHATAHVELPPRARRIP